MQAKTQFFQLYEIVPRVKQKTASYILMSFFRARAFFSSTFEKIARVYALFF